MIWKRIAGDLIVEVRSIVSILETRTEVEYSIVFTVSACQELTDCLSVVAIERFYARSWQSAAMDRSQRCYILSGLTTTYQMIIRSVTSA